MISVIYQNVNRIRTKLPQLYHNILNSDYDVICLTETNLNQGIFDGEVIDSRYNIFRKDRLQYTNSSKEEGGGVILAIKKSFQVVRRACWDSSLEDIWITIILNASSSLKLHICVCYLPPDLIVSKLDEFYTNCQNVLLNYCQDDHFLIVGDFNTPAYSPIGLVSDGPLHTPHNKKKLVLLQEFMSLCHLYQSNKIPNENGRYLDLVFSSNETLSVTQAEPLSLKDKHHPALQFQFPLKPYIDKGLNCLNKKRFNFWKCDYENIRCELSVVNWYDLLSNSDLDVCTDIFYDKLFEIIKRHTPFTSVKPQNYPVWYSKSLIKCIEEKNKYHKLYKKFNNPRDYDSFSLLRARSKKISDQCYKKYIASIEESMSDNIKHFWKFVNNRKGHSSMPQVMQLGDSSSSNGRDICEMFSQYFGSVFQSDSEEGESSINQSGRSNELFSNGAISTLSHINITEKDIMMKIKQLDAKKGPGPDELPPFFIKKCAKELCTPLYILFNKSLTLGAFPKRWKIAHIIPVYKSGDKSRCENYRQISILSCLAMLLELLVHNQLYNHFKPIISERQHGFVKSRSTVTNLLEYKNYLCKSFATGGQVDSVYTDFSKAFDKVSHTQLCIELASCGIHGNLLRWLTSYLDKRSQLVTLRGYTSSPIAVASGVPQGSHLGPLLFVVFINSLIERLSCECLLYADDLKIFKTIENTNDCNLLQRDLDTISNWCKEKLMNLNIGKCFVITFTNKCNKIVGDYTIENEVLKRCNVVKDLGVMFDDKLTFRAHYDHITKRANQLLGFVFRSTKGFKKPQSIIYLFNTLVRSILEYGSPIWSPHYKVHVDEIERVQKKCLRFLCYRQHLSRTALDYEARLSMFNIQKLESRRKYFDFIYLYKIIHSIIDVPSLLSQLSFNTRYSNRRANRTKLFALQTYKNNTSFYNPIVRMARQYNEVMLDNPEFDIFNSKLGSYIKIVKDILYCVTGA